MNRIARVWRWLLILGRRVRVVYFDRTKKVFPDTRLMHRRRDRR